MVHKHHQMYIHVELHLSVVLILEQNIGIFIKISSNFSQYSCYEYFFEFLSRLFFDLFYALIKFTHGGSTSFSMCPSTSWSGCSTVSISQEPSHGRASYLLSEKIHCERGQKIDRRPSLQHLYCM